MVHVERRTARLARPLSLLFLAALALLAASCGGGENARPAEYATNANAGPNVGVASAPEMAKDSGYARPGEYDEGGAGGERYAEIDENPFLDASRAPLSTFSIDVDTASYSNTRRFLRDGQLPPKDAVRIEELINYFSYDYPQPVGDVPFSVTTEVAQCPWNSAHRLLHVGLQGRRLDRAQMPPANLVFLIDVSGSMMDQNKLPLVKAAMSMLAEQLTARDRVGIVVYAGNSGLVLDATPGDR